MNEKTVVEALSELADKLGQRVDALWPMAVRYVVWDALVSLISAGVLLPLVVSLLCRRWWKATDNNGSDGDVVKFGLVVCLLIAWGVALANVCGAVPALLSPEGYLVTRLLEKK